MFTPEEVVITLKGSGFGFQTVRKSVFDSVIPDCGDGHGGDKVPY